MEEYLEELLTIHSEHQAHFEHCCDDDLTTGDDFSDI